MAKEEFYVVSDLDGSVYALRAADGSLLWRTHTTHANGVLSLVEITDETVYALRTSDGAPLWQVQTGYQRVSAPQVAGGVLYVVGFTLTHPASSVVAVRVGDGLLLWRFMVSRAVLSSPLVSVSDGRVLTLPTSRSTVALRWSTPPVRPGT